MDYRKFMKMVLEYGEKCKSGDVQGSWKEYQKLCDVVVWVDFTAFPENWSSEKTLANA